MRKEATSSGVGSLMQAKLHLRPSHKHFSGLISSACTTPVARSSAATPARSSFFIFVYVVVNTVSQDSRDAGAFANMDVVDNGYYKSELIRSGAPVRPPPNALPYPLGPEDWADADVAISNTAVPIRSSFFILASEPY